MKANVLKDASFRADAGRFVWLAVNTERSVTAKFQKQFPFPAWPTFFIIDPTTERVALRWVGGMSVAQTHAFLDEGAAVVARGGGADLTALEGALARADSLYAAGQDAPAAAAYEEVLALAPEGWPPYARTLESALFALSNADSAEAVMRWVETGLPRVTGTPSEGNLAATALSSALSLAKDHPRRADWVARYEAHCTRLAENPAPGASGDDVAGLYATLSDARESAGDSLGQRAVLLKWLAFMEHAIATAPSAEARTVFDGNLVEVCHMLETPEKAVPYLLANERDLPEDYNPAARLGLAYLYMKQYDKALAANDRALAKVYGPRKVRVLTIRTDILTAMGNKAGAMAALRDAVAFADALPDGQRSERQVTALRKRLADAEAAAAN